MPVCSVRFCGNSDYKSKKDATQTRFYRPPTAATGKPWIPPEHLKPNQTEVRVCSDHFLPTDFISDSVKILKPESVPTQKLPRIATHNLSINTGCIYDGGECQVVAGDVVINVRLDKNKKPGLGMTLVEHRSTNTTVEPRIDELETKLNRRLQKLKKRLANAQEKLKIRKQTRIKVMKHVHQEQKRGLHARNADLRRRNHELQLTLDQNQGLLQKCFSPTQLQVLKKGHSGTHWSEEDICKAIVLKARSSSGYELVRTAWGIPLPGLRTLRRWISKIDFETGILKPVMSLLTQEFRLASKFRQKCVISFDEMGVDGLIAYDVKNDRIVGPHSNFMVAFARGLLEKYKQPIFADFDFTFTKSTMQGIVTSLRKANLDPCAVVCDLGPNNKRVKNDFGVTDDQTWFTCSETGNKIWWFYDLPHLIKRLRDNVLDYTITLKDGTTFSREDFELLLKCDCAEFRAHFKLTRKHLNCQGRERMNVRMAMELFSRHTAECFRKYFSFDARLQRLADFIELVNDYIDILNTRRASEKNYTASPEQELILTRMEDEIQGLRVGKAKRLLPFQHGIIISIHSLRGLFADVRDAPLHVKYLMTHRLNQDIAENAFSVIRGMGRFNDHPTPMEAMSRLKLMMLSWTLNPTKSGNSEHVAEAQPYLTSGMLTSMMEKSDCGKVDHYRLCEADELEMLEIDPTPNNHINEKTWKEFNSSLSFRGRFAADAEEYVYGYILSKVKEKYPQLVLDLTLEQRVPQSWTQIIGQGKLTLPSYALLNNFKQFEQYFLIYHRKQEGHKFDLNRSIGVCAGLVEILAENFPNIPQEIVKLYVKVRTIIRIRAINNELKKLRFNRLNKNAQFLKSFVPNVEPFRPKEREQANDEETREQLLETSQAEEGELEYESDWQSLCSEFDQVSLDEETEASFEDS